MADRPRNAPVDFDLTGDNAGATTSALSVDTPVQDVAPTPRLREHRTHDASSDDRSPDSVIESHLWYGRHGSVDEDLEQNFHRLDLFAGWGGAVAARRHGEPAPNYMC